MKLTIDQFDTIHMSLRRASAISRLIAESWQGQEQIETPADTISAATYLVVDLLATAQQMLLKVRDAEEGGVPQRVNIESYCPLGKNQRQYSGFSLPYYRTVKKMFR